MNKDYRAVLGALPGKSGTLRRGITTGTCAQAAAKAAFLALLSGSAPRDVDITLPRGKKPWSGKKIRVPVESVILGDSSATAAVIKDAGDDADVTHGLAIVVTVRPSSEEGIHIRGGKGVGVVVKPGLPMPVGEAAINPVPRTMIRSELEPLLREEHGASAASMRGLNVLIEIPGGELVASKTWNTRIGIQGGLSIIGTSGVVEPASSAAFRRSIYRSAMAMRTRGIQDLYISPGYVGEKYLRAKGMPEERILTVGDHIGFTLDRCAALGFKQLELVGHVGKMVKVAAGIFNTHSKYGDGRLETLAAHAGALGAPLVLVERILGLKLAEEAVTLLAKAGYGEVFYRVAQRAAERAEERCGLPMACTVLNLQGSALARWPSPKAERKLGSKTGSVTVIGMGPGPVAYLLPQAWKTLRQAEVLAGDERHLEALASFFPDVPTLAFGGPMERFLDRLEEAAATERVALLVSGDPSLYSLGSLLRRHLKLDLVKTIPGLSAFQILCCGKGIAWDDGEFLSVHGRSLDCLKRITGDRTAIIFADGKNNPAVIARTLMEQFEKSKSMIVGERMGYPDERVVEGTLEEIAMQTFTGLSVVIVQE